MNIHIQCLDLILLMVTFSAITLSQLFFNTKKYSLEKNLKILFYVYLTLLLCVFSIAREKFYINLPANHNWYIFSLIAAPLCLLVEIFATYIILSIFNKKASKIQLSTLWQNPNKKNVLLSILIAICEEIVFRQIWFHILFKDFRLPIIIVLIISSFIYGLNHIFLGKQVLFQKILAGFIYGFLFYCSGFSIIIPIITHCLENIIILCKKS